VIKMSYEGNIINEEIVLEKLAYNSRIFSKNHKSIVLFLRNTQTVIDEKNSNVYKKVFKFLTLDKDKQPITIGHLIIQLHKGEE